MNISDARRLINVINLMSKDAYEELQWTGHLNELFPMFDWRYNAKYGCIDVVYKQDAFIQADIPMDCLIQNPKYQT